jgi:hypothetical protein
LPAYESWGSRHLVRIRTEWCIGRAPGKSRLKLDVLVDRGNVEGIATVTSSSRSDRAL